MERISINPDICSGKPCIKGTRIMVKNILGMLAGGYTIEKIIESYPELQKEDIVAAMRIFQISGFSNNHIRALFD